ncbi:MAG: nicotinate (nicotinamide) nucleotide adenylyltransferase [Bacteroidales bacterium]|nr:nicotinate (nicotinamide) nucleotide adenylyltransferase [Bacteroidales bacterium]
MKRQALYFGTFNPLHIGHVTVLRYLLQCGSFDRVAVVVSPQSPFKSDLEDSAKKRLEGVKKDVAKLGLDVEVLDTEFHLNPPYYTVNTLKYISDSMPGWQQILVMGADNVKGLENWHNSRELLDSYEIWVYPRPGYRVKTACKRLGLKLIDAPTVDISSTEIREKKIGRGI